MTKPVGFDQKVLLHHLDFTATNVKKFSRKEMYELLDGFLRNDITGAKSRKNAITMLMKIWYLIDEELIPVRNKILTLLPELTKEERLVVHWGMTLAAYPFFKDVAGEIGRLLYLQDTVSSNVIGKRIKESYGDRRRVEVATSAVLMSMKAWDAIKPEKNKTYSLSDKIMISNPQIQVFIVHILLFVLKNRAIQVDTIQNHILLFPFSYEFNLFELRQDSELIFHRQGVNELVVERKIS
ncbi:hypothetical protein [Bacillus sp. AFS017336]|uniref:hypothetical protein n=1 Tax=Bacillus sp. AFS017336 TaxID=2033489 RepID=UPI000BF0F307|nr:hypothetical protein [Bacillus sp. AFS017336]PEK99504.1 hypothetical protein CN601_23840 [Bacillus sp. AFS017336]